MFSLSVQKSEDTKLFRCCDSSCEEFFKVMFCCCGGNGCCSKEGPAKFEGQDFHELKKAALKSGQPFEDPMFDPAEPGMLDPRHAVGVEWLRPGVSLD